MVDDIVACGGSMVDRIKKIIQTQPNKTLEINRKIKYTTYV